MPTRAESHTCHADGCDAHVPPRMFMCSKHWFTLPKRMRDELWGVYVPGQENRMDPTQEYLDVARRCIEYVKLKEAA